MIRPLNCPVCERDLPVEITGDSALFPFCSRRCKEIDLARWLDGHYTLIEDLTPEQLGEQLQKQRPEGFDSEE